MLCIGHPSYKRSLLQILQISTWKKKIQQFLKVVENVVRYALCGCSQVPVRGEEKKAEIKE
jgi:hypothetical protein